MYSHFLPTGNLSLEKVLESVSKSTFDDVIAYLKQLGSERDLQELEAELRKKLTRANLEIQEAANIKKTIALLVRIEHDRQDNEFNAWHASVTGKPR